MLVPPAIVDETNWQALGWAFAATDAPKIDIFASVVDCRLAARKTTCGWVFTVRPLGRQEPLARARGTVTYWHGRVRWSYDTGARRRGLYP